MLSILFFCFLLLVVDQLQFIEALNLCYKTGDSQLLELYLTSNALHEKQHFLRLKFYETLYIESYKTFEIPCVTYYGDKISKLASSSHDMCMISPIPCATYYGDKISKLASSSHDMCMISPPFCKNQPELLLSMHDADTCMASNKKIPLSYDLSSQLRQIVIPLQYGTTAICTYAKNWNETFNAHKSNPFELFPFSDFEHIAYNTPDVWNRIYTAVFCENGFIAILLSLSEKNFTPKHHYNTYRFKSNKPPQPDRFCSFISCSPFITILKCSNLAYMLRRNFMKKHDYAAQWLERRLKIISSSSHGYCISTGERKTRERDESKIKSPKPSIVETKDGDIEINYGFKNYYFYAGGRHQITVSGDIVREHLLNCAGNKLWNNNHYFDEMDFEFKGYKLLSDVLNDMFDQDARLFFSTIPLHHLLKYLNMKELRDIAVLHKISIPHRIKKEEMLAYFQDHHCTYCDLYVSVLTEKKKRAFTTKKEKVRTYENLEILSLPSKFPPDPPSNELIESIIKGFCNDTAPSQFIEGGCAICGKLSPINGMDLLDEVNCDLSMISPGNVGRCERLDKSEPVIPLKGPILAEDCSHICHPCQLFLKKRVMPPESLANSFWIGPIPSTLQKLTFAEKMLISKIRHNKCLVRVSSGRAKMTANVIMFSNPTVKVYHALPPSRQEISEILAFVFQGPAQPTENDITRTPMLVRRNVVKDALSWLKLNHVDYEDLQISFENLNDYPLAGVPVNIEYSKSDSESVNKIVSAMSVYDDEFEDGSTDGPCPFTVHGLTGPEFENMSMDRLKARALQHLAESGTTLGISHDSKPQSMYDNPQAYPQMFPWLFPYGFGGIGQKCHFGKISETTHKRNLLMYYDKRFQTDLYFPMIAFNHEQLKAGVTGSFLLTKKKMWPDISKRLQSLNHGVLKMISDKLSDGSHFTPSTAEEKKCFQLLTDLDHVGGFVKGSITSKKHMRNEIWSMISQLGAPSWFITLSPADSRHPICLYYADKNIEFKPDLRSANERNLLVAQNPVAAARFFDLMVRTFIKHVLGIGSGHSGLYGDTSGYYGTVEQQGRLTLHLHLILWIKSALSPQEIRDKLMNEDGEFQQNLIKYLEGCQKGEFITGTMEYVKAKIPVNVDNHTKGIHSIFNKDLSQSTIKLYQDPTQTLPDEPPNSCTSSEHIHCSACPLSTRWWQKFYDTVDDILLRSNVHSCSSSDPSKPKFKPKGCLNKDGVCKARFPRLIVPETTVNLEDGYITMKKMESMLNTITPCVTYLFRCNTDVTSLLSGTTIKAVISYVTDYVAKPTLKTYQIFATAYNIFDRNSSLDADDSSRTDDARKLILKIVNALSSKMEIGSPMASMYLLDNPDHYTSHKFTPFWWKSFINDVTQETSKKNTCQNLDDDIKMEDVFQEGAEETNLLSKEKKVDNHDIDIEMEGEFEGEKKILSNNNHSKYLGIYTRSTTSSEFNANVSFADEMAMKIDDPLSSFGGGPKAMQRDESISIRKGDNHIDIEMYDDLEGQDSDVANDEDVDLNNDENEDDLEEEDDPTDEKLLISQNGGDYVVSSKVDDYKYRPEACASLSVYDWTKISEKVKASRKNDLKTCLQFLPGHGQRNTHVAKLILSRSETYVLNFIGGPLPRRDQGDFEYYCRTMLTLFKPWRSSQDLKEAHQSWADAFASYEFKPENKKIMDNFNLRYECLDERDDYHAILKRQSKLKESKASSLFQDQYDNDCDLGVTSNFEEDFGDQKILGPNAIRKAQQMIEAEAMMIKAGWLDAKDYIGLGLNVREFHPAICKTASQWKALVKEHRKNVLNEKKSHYSSTTAAIQKGKTKGLESSESAVKLLPSEYFMHNFKIKEARDSEIISNTILDFSLNREQKRAFHIIANHASECYSEQLKMYLGGMGGTGKTRVIKALMSMFAQKQENHRFIVLAPTGTAAALLNGSTYHSILGIRSSNNNSGEESPRDENSVIKEVQERLEGVDYIFIDEISMIACHELYAISSQFSKVTNDHSKPFGGINVIFAGDFAQLPPTNGSPLYSNNVSNDQKSSMSKRDQESTIGKLLWHQVTTVVILTQNMRQREMSEDDIKFRAALSNMRYAACTNDDLEFLKTLHVNRNNSNKSLTDPNFRNVSIITSLNTQKDQINELCSIRFARDTGQQLTHFFSVDCLGNTELGRKRRRSRASKKISANVHIPIDIQKTLWDSSPHSSEHFPGKLSLCLGMPIMIRNNDATELCITKGQEAYVVGWDAVVGLKGENILETLYLELKNPPKPIKLPHLPENVIPMVKMSKKIKCSLPNDYEMNVVRQQVNVLPNFSMTDYASQGKTRSRNPVNLSHCRNFQSIYTCLSRSSSAAGTLIVQGFNANKVTKGLSGHLRQEFRELHTLDEITKVIYEGQLNKKYFGPLRNPMIYKYQTEIKKNVSGVLHRALRLFDGERIIKEKGDDGTWNLSIYQKLTDPNKTDMGLKRKTSAIRIFNESACLKTGSKKIRLSLTSSQYLNSGSPVGLIWDEEDYSCAYDSLFTVLYHVWNEGREIHKAYFENGTELIRILHSKFTSLSNETCTFESVRDYLRSKLNNEKPLQYRYGKNYTDIDELVRDLTSEKTYGISYLQCQKCTFSVKKKSLYLRDYTAVGWSSLDKEILQQTASVQRYLNYKTIKFKEITDSICLRCRESRKKDSLLYNTQHIDELPTILIFALAPWIEINKSLKFNVSNLSKEYNLKGIIYSNGDHFTARLIDDSLIVWYHDGQTTRSHCRKEQCLLQTDDVVPLKTDGRYKAILVFYAQKQRSP